MNKKQFFNRGEIKYYINSIYIIIIILAIKLYLMINCKHAVLANSSYSWWGAWLNPDPGIRVAPVKWFNSEKEDPRDIVPEGWIRL